MSLTQIFLFDFLHLEIITLGIIVLILLGVFSQKIIRKYVILKNRMRLLYGYIAAIFCIISLVIFGYFFVPFGDVTTELLIIEVTPFSAGTYYSVSIGIIILLFICIVETQFNSERSYLAFVALLLIQLASFFILSSTSWLLIFSGFILLFAGINIFIRYLQVFNEKNAEDLFSPYTTINGISIALLFIGLASHYVSSGSFVFFDFNLSGEIWEYLSIIFILISILIQIGGPPFHLVFFKQSENNNISTSNILVIIQRGIAIVFLVKYSIVIRNSKISPVLLILLIILGTLYSLWGSLATFTVKKMFKMLYYISIIQVGIAFLVLSSVFSSQIENKQLDSIVQSLSFFSVSYILLFSFSFAAVSLISKGYKTDDIDLIKGIGKKSLISSIIILVSFIFQFVFPIFVGSFASLFSFDNTWITEFYYISILVIITLLLTSVYVIRISRKIFQEKSRSYLEFSSSEPGIHISLLLSIFLVIGLVIFCVKLIDFCLMMAVSLIN